MTGDCDNWRVLRINSFFFRSPNHAAVTSNISHNLVLAPASPPLILTQSQADLAAHSNAHHGRHTVVDPAVSSTAPLRQTPRNLRRRTSSGRQDFPRQRALLGTFLHRHLAHRWLQSAEGTEWEYYHQSMGYRVSGNCPKDMHAPSDTGRDC